ncbi:MAG: restriction endonuclease subunit S [Tenuifilaceae bacterium]|nr:restriction endonuclease subunit S [Tenuifilaceae bacterium]
MKKYEKYKHSGIEWIGEIPEHWGIARLKFVGQSIIGITYSPDDVVNEDEGILVLRSSNIQEGKLAFDDCVFVSKEINKKHIVKNGDILLCARNGSAHLVGKSAYIDEKNEGTTFGAFMSIVRSSLGKYLFYFFNSTIFKAQTGLFSTSTINQLTSDTLDNMSIAFPKSIEEQTAIATYLDRKTAEIDQLIDAKKRLIELYHEEKTAIINQAVTKGINPNAKMKDSGIEWLGEIPEHWEVKRLKYFFNLITEKKENDLKKIGLENIESNKGSFIETNSDFEGQGVIFRVNDILFGKLRPYLAKVWLASFEGQAVGDFYVFRSKDNVLPAFAKYRLLDTSFIEITNSSTYGSKMPRVSWEFIADLNIAFPPIEEQQSIVNHIEAECSRLDTKIERTQRLIELLAEYRTALISEVVTGKVKVV